MVVCLVCVGGTRVVVWWCWFVLWCDVRSGCFVLVMWMRYCLVLCRRFFADVFVCGCLYGVG